MFDKLLLDLSGKLHWDQIYCSTGQTNDNDVYLSAAECGGSAQICS